MPDEGRCVFPEILFFSLPRDCMQNNNGTLSAQPSALVSLLRLERGLLRLRLSRICNLYRFCPTLHGIDTLYHVYLLLRSVLYHHAGLFLCEHRFSL